MNSVDNAVYGIALGTRPDFESGSSWLRVGAVVAMWAAAWPVVASFDWRTIALLLITTLGVIASWVHAREELVDRLSNSSVRWVGRLADHLLDSYGTAQFDVPGVMELIGGVSAIFVFLTPWASTDLAAGRETLGITALVVYVAGALFNVSLDPGLYEPEPNRDGGLVLAARLAPAATALAAAALLFIVPGPADSVAPSTRALLAVSLLILYLIMWAVAAVHRAAETTLADIVNAKLDLWQAQSHTVLSNPLSMTLASVSEPEPDIEEVRHHARAARTATAELPYIGREPVEIGSFERLLEVSTKVLELEERTAVECGPASLAIQFDKPPDYAIAKTVLIDLLDNAAKSGATHISVACDWVRLPTSSGSVPHARITLSVADNGPGMKPEHAGASLKCLRQIIERSDGEMTLRSEPGRGTTWTVWWISKPQYARLSRTRPNSGRITPPADKEQSE